MKSFLLQWEDHVIKTTWSWFIRSLEKVGFRLQFFSSDLLTLLEEMEEWPRVERKQNLFCKYSDLQVPDPNATIVGECFNTNLGIFRSLITVLVNTLFIAITRQTLKCAKLHMGNYLV